MASRFAALGQNVSLCYRSVLASTVTRRGYRGKGRGFVQGGGFMHAAAHAVLPGGCQLVV